MSQAEKQRIEALRAAGATEIIIAADGSITAKFCAQPMYVPTFWPMYPYPWWQSQQPTITWGSADSASGGVVTVTETWLSQ